MKDSESLGNGPPRDGAWAGQPAWVVGGGPSLRGFDFEQIRGLGRVLAVNTSFFEVPFADGVYIGDQRLIESLADCPEFTAFEGWRVTRRNHYDRSRTRGWFDAVLDPRADQWSYKLENGIADWGCSGAAAVNLADMLWADPIFLLGFDCKGTATDGGTENYHDRYPAEWKKSARAMLPKFTKIFQRVAQVAAATVSTVTTRGGESALDCFNRLPLIVAMEDAAAAISAAEERAREFSRWTA